ncbi:ABC transporter permease [Candidatus Uabimicrobium amorphum]|nr:iron ABC transporter permease [Candidatus Uabimicrobium amorphum]
MPVYDNIPLLLTNTFIYCAASALFALLIGIFMGYMLFRVHFPGRKLAKYIAVVAIAIPSHIQISAWIGFFGRSGILTPYLQTILPNFSLYNIYGCIWISAWAYAPLATICCGVMLHNIDEKIEIEATTYRSPIFVFLSVLLPLIKKNLLLLFSCLFFLIFADVKVTDVLGFQNTLTQKIYLLFNIYYQPQLALSLCIPGFVLLAFFIAAIKSLRPAMFHTTQHKFLYHLGKWKLLFVSITFVILCCYWLALPILIYITQSFEKFYTVFQAIDSEIVHSLYICTLSTTMIVVLATPLAWYIKRVPKSFFVTYTVGALLWLAFIPGPIAGIATVRIVSFLSSLPIVGDFFYFCQDTSVVLVWALTAKFLPVGIMFMYFTISQITPRWEILSAIDGHSTWQTFFRVVLPICKRQMAFCGAIIFIFCMGETIISTLVIAPGTTTLAIRILTLIHNGARADLSAASLWFLVVIFCIVAIIFAYNSQNKILTTNRKNIL